MSNPVYSDIQYDVGDARNLTGGTTAVNSILTKAKNQIKAITGTTTGPEEDLAIRNLACAYTVNAIMGGLGPETVNDKNYAIQRDFFMTQAENALKLIGKSISPYSIQFEQVNP